MTYQVAFKLEKTTNIDDSINESLSVQSSQDGESREDQLTDDYFPIPLKTLQVDTIPGFNIFLHLPGKNRYVLYRSGSVKFTEEHKNKLSENRIANIFIKSSERRLYNRYIEKHLTEIIADDSIAIEKKSEMVYQCSSDLLQDIFQRTGLVENIPRVSKMVKNTVEHLYKGTGAFISMLDVMSHDYYTFTHSVNVCVIGVALGQSVGLNRDELSDLGAGLLLHDLGKSKIDERILNKRGPLNEEEWKIIRQHPEVGAKIAARTNRVAPLSLQVIRQHHEKSTGKGYPVGLIEQRIHLFGRIAAIVDVYDALTTERPYKAALNAFSAVQLMQKEMGNDFSPILFKQSLLLLTKTQ